MLKRNIDYGELRKLDISEDINNNLPDIEQLKLLFRSKNINALSVDIELKKDISFLINFKDILFLRISPIMNINDIKILNEFKKLKHLRLNGLFITNSFQKYFYPEKEDHNDLKIDFSYFKELETLGIFGKINKKHIKNLESCTVLNTLFLENYKDKDLEIVFELKNLKALTVNSSSIKSLKGIEKLENLEYLSLEYLLSLRDISHISQLKNLKQLTIDTCSKIYDYDALFGLENLEELEISNNRDIKDLKFLLNLKKLRLFKMGQSSNVVDGDLSYTDYIEKAYFPSRKHYNR